MQIEKCLKKTKCDMFGCNNLAEHSLSTKGVLKRELCLCDECLRGIYEEVQKMEVPKGTKSPFRLKDRIRRKNED